MSKAPRYIEPIAGDHLEVSDIHEHAHSHVVHGHEVAHSHRHVHASDGDHYSGTKGHVHVAGDLEDLRPAPEGGNSYNLPVPDFGKVNRLDHGPAFRPPMGQKVHNGPYLEKDRDKAERSALSVALAAPQTAGQIALSYVEASKLNRTVYNAAALARSYSGLPASDVEKRMPGAAAALAQAGLLGQAQDGTVVVLSADEADSFIALSRTDEELFAAAAAELEAAGYLSGEDDGDVALTPRDLEEAEVALGASIGVGSDAALADGVQAEVFRLSQLHQADYLRSRGRRVPPGFGGF